MRGRDRQVRAGEMRVRIETVKRESRTLREEKLREREGENKSGEI